MRLKVKNAFFDFCRKMHILTFCDENPTFGTCSSHHTLDSRFLICGAALYTYGLQNKSCMVRYVEAIAEQSCETIPKKVNFQFFDFSL